MIRAEAAERPGPGLGLRDQVRRRRRRRKVLAGSAILLALLVLAWIVGWSPLLDVRQISVQGETLVSQQQVEQAAQVPLGTPLAQLDTATIARRIEQLPAVSSARVARSWPHMAVLEITERTLVYQRQDAGQYQWVDPNGVIFHATAERQQVPLADVASPGDTQLLADIATVVRVLPAGLRGRVQSVEASSLNNIVLVLDRNQTVFWGSADQSGLKASLLPVLLSQPGNVYDISSPSHPAVK